MDNVLLLADPTSRAWDFAIKIQRYIREKKNLDIPLREVSIKHFNNGEIDMHVPETVRQKEIYFVHDSTKNPPEWWAELLLLKDLLLNASAKEVTFVLPDLLYSRKDRKERSHVPISARALANSISKGIKRIVTMDLHAPQIQGFYPAEIPLNNLYSFPEAAKYIYKNHLNESDRLVIVSPDAGGVHRAKSFLKRLEIHKDSFSQKEFSFALISKTRPKAGEIEEMQLVGDVSNKDVLIIDDIIDTGGTLCKAADLLRRNGAKKIFCYGTHGIFSKGNIHLVNFFDKIMTSNTHYRNEDELAGIEIIDVSSVFAEAIYRTQKGLPISSLFE